ncbi:MAG: protoporphyrinogen oxidase [Planctomycetaceae bacterium]|nr:MAG: protoporphyrinogen oxidase [Planctomycetaceae bacterium]
MAGLVAAHHLRRQDSGCDVEVFEASSRCGGLIRTERVDGYLLEHGADMFATQPDAALRLCESLGIADRLILPQPGTRGAAIVDRGRVLRVPDGFVLMRATRLLPMLTTPLLSLRGKLRLAMEGLVRPRPEDQEDESIESFVVRRMGREVLDRIVQPLVGGIYTGDVKKLSMAATMGQFLKMESESGSLCRATFARRRSGVDSTERTSAGARYEQFRSLPGGLQELLDALQESLPAESLRTGQRVTRLESAAGGWRLWGDAEANGGDWGEFDHVVLALPAALSARLLGDLAPDVAQRLRGIVAASSAVVALGVRESDIARPVDIAGFVVPLRERRPILAASFTSDKFAGRAPAGEKLIRVFFGGELQREWLERDDEELIRIAREQLAELIGLGGPPRLARVIRWNDAMPQYRVGHLQRVREIEAGLAAHAGLHLIGNSLHGVGIAPTVLAAERVATRILTESASALPG